jgi:hypothetical protein
MIQHKKGVLCTPQSIKAQLKRLVSKYNQALSNYSAILGKNTRRASYWAQVLNKFRLATRTLIDYLATHQALRKASPTNA